MTRRAIISIGVSKAGDLPTLEAAVPDARTFAEWGRNNGYGDVRLIEDSAGPVRAADIVRAVDEVISRDPERLLLYFSGHGTSTGVAEYWLLSDFHRNSNEAINVLASFNNAKRLPIEQIAVFADACRSTIPTLSFVTGSVIFPLATQASEVRPKWDHFFATRLSEIAQEVPGAEDRKAFGVFSKCLFKALSGEEPSVLQPRDVPRPLRVLCSDKLADWIDEKVPEESGRIPGARVQIPETAAGWRQPHDIYLEVDAASVAPPPPPPVPSPPPSRWIDIGRVGYGGGPAGPSTGFERVPMERYGGSSPPVFGGGSGGGDTGLAAAQRKVEAARSAIDRTAERAGAELKIEGRHSFETGRGITVHGSRVTDVIASGRPFDLFEEGGLDHIRGHAEGPQTVIFRTKEGTWVPTVILPGFNAIITLSEGAVVGFNYFEIGEGLDLHSEQMLRRWTALMTVGQAPAKELLKLAQVVRSEKHSNPVLGVLAAYAYERAGALDQIDDIVGYFADRRQPVIFDIAMLSTYCTARKPGRAFFTDGVKHRGAARDATIAGTFPLMARGWATLDPRDPLVHPELVGLCPGLVPSLWTTLRPDAGKRLAKLIESGEL